MLNDYEVTVEKITLETYVVKAENIKQVRAMANEKDAEYAIEAWGQFVESSGPTVRKLWVRRSRVNQYFGDDE